MTMVLAALIEHPSTVMAGWILLLILWETTAVGIGYAAWRMWHSRDSARQQHRAAVTAFTGALVLSAVTPLLLFSLPAPPPESLRTVIMSAPPVPLAAANSQASGSVGPDRRPSVSITPDRIAGGAAALWLLGVAVLAVRLAGGWLLARSIRNRATGVTDSNVLDVARRLGEDLELSSPVPLLESRHVEAPVVVGSRQPALILPADVTERLSTEMVASVLAHEFAHIQRRDYLANMLQSIAELLLFFSPAVIWMSRCIREAREYCCDDAAVARCGDAKHYVQALTTLASLGTVNAAHPAMGAAGPRLITRVRRLLQYEAMPRFSAARVAVFALAVAILVASGARITTASASRAARWIAPAAPTSSASRQSPLPYGYTTEQEGSGVVLGISRPTPDEPVTRASVRNTTNEPVTGVRMVAAVERFRAGFGGFRLPVELFVSEMLPVSIPPGANVEIPAELVTQADLDRIAAATPDARLQLFFGLSGVRYANGFEWSITPNPAALNGSDVFGIARPQVPRALISADADPPQLSRSMISPPADRPPVRYRPCRDDRDRAYSHGARVSVAAEPGRYARCEDGRWVEAALGR